MWCKDVTSDGTRLGPPQNAASKAFSQFYLEVTPFSSLRIFPHNVKNVLWGSYSNDLMEKACPGDSDFDMTQTSEEGHVAF